MKFQHSYLGSGLSARGLALVGLSALLTVGFAAPTKLTNLPLSLDPGAKLFVMSDAYLLKKFPTGSCPDLLFKTSDDKVSIAFEWRGTKLTPADVNTMLTQFPAVIMAQVPGIKTLNKQMLKLNGNDWADFVFVAPNKLGDVRRELLITSAQGRMLIVTVSSNLADYGKNEADVKALTGSMTLN